MERLLVFADFNWLVSPELVGELCYEKLRGSDSYAFKFDENWLKGHAGIKLSEDINNYPACNIPSQEVIFSDAFLMHCQIGGGVPCSKEENRYRLQKRRELSELFPLSITSWVLMTSPEWVDLGSKGKWKAIISMCHHLSGYLH